MKLQYQSPMISFMLLSTEDILTLSVGDSTEGQKLAGESWNEFVQKLKV